MLTVRLLPDASTTDSEVSGAVSMFLEADDHLRITLAGKSV